MQDTFARTRTRPKGDKPSTGATIGYLVYNRGGSFDLYKSGNIRIAVFAIITCIYNLEVGGS